MFRRVSAMAKSILSSRSIECLSLRHKRMNVCSILHTSQLPVNLISNPNSVNPTTTIAYTSERLTNIPR